MQYALILHSSISEIDSAQWNVLADKNPFLLHPFLLALEQSYCVGINGKVDSGWQPLIACAYLNKKLVAAIPCYQKIHSYGEYVFDWQWANAFHRHGINYYPKLVNTIPFTPATTNKWLLAPNQSPCALDALFQKLVTFALQNNFSSLHSLFISKQDYAYLNNLDTRINYNNPSAKNVKTDADIPLIDEISELDKQTHCKPIFRNDIQYHWHHNNSEPYQNFSEYLSTLQRKKRKNIVNERNSIAAQGITIEMIEGIDLQAEDWDLFHQCYQSTIALYGSRAYLNKDFFDLIGANMKENVVMAKARYCEKYFACALFFKSDNTLFGRYWGSLYEMKNLHFELCYYQGIEYCINNKLARFEAGAQGSHKLSRGLLAEKTTSAHFIFHPQFAEAIDNYVGEEREAISQYQQELLNHSPFKA